MCDATDYVRITREPASIDGQENIRRIVVGGEDDRGRLVDTSRLYGLQIRRIADHHLVGTVRKGIANGLIAIEHRHASAPLAQRLGHRTPDATSPDHEHRRINLVIDHEERIEFRDLLFGADNDGHAVFGQNSFGSRRLKVPTLPHPHHVKPRELSQIRVANSTSHERSSVDRELRDNEIFEAADSMC